MGEDQQQFNSPSFGILNPIKPTNQVVANSPSGGSDIGNALQGLAGIVQGYKNHVANNNPTGSVNPSYNPVSPSQSLYDILNGNAKQEQGLTGKDLTLKTYLQRANPGLDPSVTPWCAGFVNSVLNASGVKGTGSLAAKSYLNFGTPSSNPQTGDIVVFNDLTGRNDPNHGHVGFVQGIDRQNGTVSVLGGNQDNSVSVKSYPLSSVAGFRTPPSGKEVQQFGIKNNMNPQQIANLPKQMNQPQNTQVNPLAVSTIKDFEEFTPKAAWDVNAYRAGYGSDTTTRPDGKVVKVTPGMEINQDDANRDVERRTLEFQNATAQQVGDKWNNMSPGAQAALTSVAYNYGSIPKKILSSIQSGDTDKMADAVASLAGDNNGINRNRRLKEANMIRQGAEDDYSSPSSDVGVRTLSPDKTPNSPEEVYTLPVANPNTSDGVGANRTIMNQNPIWSGENLTNIMGTSDQNK